ncbi:FMN-binding protein [Actinoplanes sp. NPDC051859]|uniref:FMN-binding protein n=1 Tax=Actinoplanes sp. NPDC051859 TaxID=3363909 RepID=UPI0037AB5107
MRRSTAAAVGTLTGAALIVGVRLSVSAPAVPVAAPPAVDLTGSGQDASTPSKKPDKNGSDKEESGSDSSDSSSSEGAAGGSGLKNGVFKGSASKNPYGTVQVSIKIQNGKITAADATYPTSADSGTINPPAVQSLNQSTVKAQSAEVDAVSGATFTSDSYAKSLQAAIDAANA